MPTLRSNSGRDELVFEFGRALEYGSENGFETRVALRGKDWDGDEEHDISVVVDGVWLRCDDLFAPRDRIQTWTE